MKDLARFPEPTSDPQMTDHLHLDTHPTDPDLEAVFSNIYNYPWNQDSEFRSGLASILGSNQGLDPDRPVYHDTDLLLQAQCFYFARLAALTRNMKGIGSTNSQTESTVFLAQLTSQPTSHG